MKQIQEAIVAYLEEVSGIRTVFDRTRCQGYPLLAVSVHSAGTTLLAGGRLAEHVWEVCVTAISDRDREENTALLSSLIVPLLRGIPMGERYLHPLNIHTEEETLRFDLALCLPVPPEFFDSEAATHTMEAIHLTI